jgi:hypothetical protein
LQRSIAKLRSAGSARVTRLDTTALLTPVGPTGSRTGCLRAPITPRNNRSRCRRKFSISRRDASELCVDRHPLKRRGRRESRMRAAPAVSRANGNKKTHTSIQVQRRQSGFPCAVAYGLFRALLGDRAFLPPSPLRSLLLRNLTPASGRRDHTASPSASARVRLAQAFASTASHRAFVTIATRPSHRVRRADSNH